MAMPEYTDGVLELLRIEEDCSQDFPVEKVRSTGMHIWYRELSVFDTTRAKLSADGIEVTMKISIPQYKQVNSKCICVIDGAQHEIYNVAHVTTKDGFKETELTLKTPAYDREVYATGCPVNEGISDLDNGKKFPRIDYWEIAWDDVMASGDNYEDKITWQVSFYSRTPRNEKLIMLRDMMRKKGLHPTILHEFITDDKIWHSYFALETMNE